MSNHYCCIEAYSELNYPINIYVFYHDTYLSIVNKDLELNLYLEKTGIRTLIDSIELVLDDNIVIKILEVGKDSIALIKDTRGDLLFYTFDLTKGEAKTYLFSLRRDQVEKLLNLLEEADENTQFVYKLTKYSKATATYDKVYKVFEIYLPVVPEDSKYCLGVEDAKKFANWILRTCARKVDDDLSVS